MDESNLGEQALDSWLLLSRFLSTGLGKHESVCLTQCPEDSSRRSQLVIFFFTGGLLTIWTLLGCLGTVTIEWLSFVLGFMDLFMFFLWLESINRELLFWNCLGFVLDLSKYSEMFMMVLVSCVKVFS